MTEEGVILLKRHEGLQLHAYRDSVHILTIGYGHTFNVTEGQEISEAEADVLLAGDIQIAEADVRSILPCFSGLSPRRQDAIVNMAFNLGGPKLRSFKTFIRCICAGQFEAAAGALLSSKWAHQVGRRAEDIEQAIREG